MGLTDGAIELTADQWNTRRPGTHELLLKLDANVEFTSKTSRVRPTWTGQMIVRTDFVILDKSVSTVRREVVDRLREDVRNALTPNESNANGRWGVLRLSGDSPPIDLAFDVILRMGGVEFPVGSFAVSTSDWDTHWMLSRRPRGCDARFVDVILRPSEREAAGHFRMRRIWGEEVLFQNVEFAPELGTEPQSSGPE